MSRSLSFRSRARDPPVGRPNFIASFRGIQGPELSRKLSRMITTENAAIRAHENASRDRTAVASQLSDWGETTGDDAVSDISDKIGVMLAEIGDQEGLYAQNLEESRAVLKHIRNMESSVQPSRDQRHKAMDEIAKLKLKDPNNARMETLEHELVRAEAQNLVAEAQLSNTTRTKLKEALDIHTAAVIERAEKQIILARHARRLLNFIDDTPLVPGDTRSSYDHQSGARQVLEDAEADLRAWKLSLEPIATADSPLEERGVGRGARRDSDLSSSANDAQGVIGANNALPGRGDHEPVAAVAAANVQPAPVVASY